MAANPEYPDDDWQLEQQEWEEALDDVLRHRGPEQARDLLLRLQGYLSHQGMVLTEAALNTPYKNTIDLKDQPAYPGDIDLETRIGNIIRWNAAAMVLQAYDSGSGVGGHIATYFSAATMMEVGFNHVFRARGDGSGGDQVHFQAHCSPGVYARAYLEGRLSAEQLANFRRELAAGGGLPSYPHPRRMPDFWQMPTASMGLSTPSAIYQARFAKYLERRGLKEPDGGKIWTFIGDGEADEPEVLGTVNIASRERLDNLVLVINCNLQRLDGPVRGNGKIIQELERSFRGADWHVIKVIWGGGWDPILDRDEHGLLQRRMEQAVDGDYQMYSVSSGDVVREHWVENAPELRALMASLTDEEVRSIKRGGQDHKKIYAAYHHAMRVQGKPCVILLKTVKGDGLGPGSEGANTVHQKKYLSAEERRDLAKRLGIPLSREAVERADFYRPAEDSEEIAYLKSRREALGGYLPKREVRCPSLPTPDRAVFADMLKGASREVSTTMAVVRMLSKLLRDDDIGRYVVPIVPDEARTFGMDGLFSQAGIYSPAGQRYRPVDAGSIAPYKEAEDGRILQEGICETGAMASFMAAGTAYANYGLPMIPFYIFYSIFGFQRVGDMIWACGDMMCRGFLLGGTSGRTTLNGEGVQHQDGHSHLVASTVPNLVSYDPAFAFEIALIVRDGIRRMYGEQENVFYYLTVTNQNYPQPALPERDGVEDGVLAGMYCFERQDGADINLFGSGAIMTEVLAAAELLRELGHACNVWSVTSYTELARQGLAAERRALLGVAADEPWERPNEVRHGARNTWERPNEVRHGARNTWERRNEVRHGVRNTWERPPGRESDSLDAKPLVSRLLAAERGVFVAASDYVKALPSSIDRWVPGPYTVLGTDGFGLSEGRAELRDYFEVSAAWIAFAALATRARHNLGDAGAARDLARAHGLDLGKVDPALA